MIRTTPLDKSSADVVLSCFPETLEPTPENDIYFWRSLANTPPSSLSPDYLLGSFILRGISSQGFDLSILASMVQQPHHFSFLSPLLPPSGLIFLLLFKKNKQNSSKQIQTLNIYLFYVC